MSKLAKQIEDRLGDQLRSFLQRLQPVRDTETDPFNVVLLAGNGLTRLAGYAYGKSDQSWRNSVRDAWGLTKSDVSFEALERHGKSLPAIFDLAIFRCGGKKREIKKAHEFFWNAVQEVELAQLAAREDTLHYELVRGCKRILTTNYDRMFESAWVGRGNKDIAYWTHSKLESRFNAPQSSLRMVHASQKDKLRIVYKIHGSFLLPDSFEEIRDFESAIKDFDKWCERDYGHQRTIATNRMYEQFGFQMSSADFKRDFDDVISILDNPDNLVVCIGLGLGGEEHIISRLLLSRAAGCAPIIKFDVTSSLYPDPGESKGIFPINIDPGLANSSERRFLATTIFLQVLFRDLANDINTSNRFKDLARRNRFESESIWPVSTPIFDIQPLALALGQTSINRVLGIMEPPTQEQAFGAYARATLWPDNALQKKDDKRIGELYVEQELGGQSVVPCLLWDAFGMPSMIVSGIGDDTKGDFALSEFKRTKHVDFDQVLIPEPPQSRRTDHLTVVTWAGLRSIFENNRRIRDVSYESHPFDKDRINEAKQTAKLLYLTKVASNEWMKWAPVELVDKIIVFDTGGGPCPEETQRIAELGGVIVASALAGAAEWLHQDFVDWTPQKFAFWTSSIDDRIVYNPTPEIVNKLDPPRDYSAFGNWMRKWKVAMLPADETGRAHQNLWFLKTVRRSLVPGFLSGRLQNCSAFVVTLGEYGLVYWLKKKDGWSSPYRVWYEINDLDEVRSGLSCGDCTRGGISAALIARRQRGPLSEEDYKAAFAFGAWCGSTKLRFFSIWDYHNALASQSRKLLQQLLSSSPHYGEGSLEMSLHAEEINESKIDLLINSIVDELKDPDRHIKWAQARENSGKNNIT
jgi:hypothetical protein